MAFKGTGMPAANSPPSEEGSGSKDSEAAAATPVSCVDAFDALWFCYSPAHQVRSSRLNHGTTCVAAPNFLAPPLQAMSRSAVYAVLPHGLA
jgi:hypothetical protein